VKQIHHVSDALLSVVSPIFSGNAAATTVVNLLVPQLFSVLLGMIAGAMVLALISLSGRVFKKS
ncbi:MAG: hypothetical protein NWQ45_03245, partial [Congregibacter sp.]|nr:hypothetical protein [Congregibacter sp.]